VDAYEATRQRHIEHLLAQIAEHFERVAWTAERLHAERTTQLRELIGIAVQRSTWHRDRLGDIDLTTLDADDLRHLPVMTKDDLMGNFDAIVTDPEVRLADVNAHIAKLNGDAYFRDELHAVASGGSSGMRGVFVWGWDAWATVQLTAIRRSLLDRIDDPELVSRPPVAMIVAAENATHFTSALSETFATGAIETHRFRVGLPVEEIVTGLNSVGGDNLATYPSMLARLIGEARAGRLQIQPRRILTMAEPLLPETRQAAEETWHAPVANMWGTSEAGVTAIGCFKGTGMHLSDDLVIVEAVDANGEPVPAGVRSHKVYVTNLVNPLMPLIRYEISDEVTLVDEPCECGSVHQRIADIEGTKRRHLPLRERGERAPASIPLDTGTRAGDLRVSGAADPGRSRDHRVRRWSVRRREAQLRAPRGTRTLGMPRADRHGHGSREHSASSHGQAQALPRAVAGGTQLVSCRRRPRASPESSSTAAPGLIPPRPSPAAARR
jgi:phenylacetate-CoA ligase